MNTNIKGICRITYRGETFYAAKGVKIKSECVYSSLNSSTHGSTQRVCRNVVTDISFTPIFDWTDSRFKVLFPYTNDCLGRSLFKNFGGPLAIEMISGDIIAFDNAVVFEMPAMEWGSDMLFGEVTLRSLHSPRMSRSVHYGFKHVKPKGKILFSSGPFQVTWGAEALNSAVSAKVDFTLQLDSLVADEQGIVDYIVRDVSSRITLDHYFNNAEIDSEGYYKPGQSLMSAARPLRLESPDLACVIEDVFISKRGTQCPLGNRVKTVHESLYDSRKRNFILTQN